SQQGEYLRTGVGDPAALGGAARPVRPVLQHPLAGDGRGAARLHAGVEHGGGGRPVCPGVPGQHPARRGADFDAVEVGEEARGDIAV
ncbi:hypothetical protein QN416_25690, partial [Glaciimonas sp. Cout2]|uniref:hypothetical protein n=1 Tax=Glaciimonas sp. Cout2 TaxID=3048621 RepID=UPI002B239469